VLPRMRRAAGKVLRIFSKDDRCHTQINSSPSCCSVVFLAVELGRFSVSLIVCFLQRKVSLRRWQAAKDRTMWSVLPE
jgi:hypothetical protein